MPAPATRTLIIAKPDAVARGLVGEIVRRLENKGLRLVAAQLRCIDVETAAVHYGEHRGKAFYDSLVEFITSGASFIAVVEGPPDTWRIVRSLMGSTDPVEAAPGTIRGDLATEMGRNLVHGSDSADAAGREISLFFPALVS